MTEWEQIKNEYREIPIPSDGSRLVLEAMAEAKRKRNRWNKVTRYSTVAAAAILLIVVVPWIPLVVDGFGGAKEDASMRADCIEMVPTSGSRNSARQEAEVNFKTESADEGWSNAVSNDTDKTAEAPGYGLYDESDMADHRAQIEEAGQGGIPAWTEQKDAISKEILAWTEQKDAISKEILRQMEERMQTEGETYFIKGEAYPEGFESITEEQEYYINTEGLLVFVFEAGTVAPEEQGIIEFVIPAEVAVP